MAVHPIGIRGTDSGYAPSDSIWGKIPWAGIREGKIDGVAYEWNFGNFRTSSNINAAEAGWDQGLAAFGDNGGFITAVDAIGGGVSLGSDGDNEGASVRQVVAPFQLSQHLPYRFAFEARVKTSTIADTKHDIFLGLIENVALSAVIPITAAGAIADKNLVGFFRPETARSSAGTGGAILNTVYKCDGVTAVNVQTDAVTLVADTYVKLGIVYEPYGDIAGSYRLSFYQNGTRLTTSKQVTNNTGTDFPSDMRLGFCFAVLNATGSTPGNSVIQWARVAQLLS